jgi:hypothetical protein
MAFVQAGGFPQLQEGAGSAICLGNNDLESRFEDSISLACYL